MNKKITSSALAALMIAGSTSFTALAAMSNGTVVIGNKAFDLTYANDPANADEIGNAIVAGGNAVYIKDFEGNWVDNATNKKVEASVIPAVVYKGADKKEVKFDAADKVAVANEVKVESVKANTAKSFLVKFNKAITDEDKITFAVTRLTTALTVTTTWNADKTEATLSSSANLAEATFAVSVLKDAKEIAKENVTIAAQKVAKVEFTSKAVSVKLSGDRAGFVTYKVYDQYNNDITTSYLANNMTFQSGAVSGTGTVVGKNGLITITPDAAGTSLIQFPNVSVIAYDTTSGVSATVTLPTSSAIGTLSEFAFGSSDSLKLAEGDVTSVFYIPYTASDMSGNVTSDYDLVKGGLIFAAANTTDLVVSLPGSVSARLVQDPADSRKAAIEVKVKTNNTPLSMDMPVTITAMTYTGKTSSVQTTLVKSKALTSFSLLAPSQTVAVGESPVLSFEAYDQLGNKITKYAEIKNKVSETGFTITRKVDGTAKIKMNALNTKGVASLAAVVSATGKMSTLNINVQDAAKPSRLSIDTTDIVAAMEHGATQSIVVGDDDEVIVYDQYDRKMSDGRINGTFSAGNAYKIVATNLSGDVDINGADAAVNLTTPGSITIAANSVIGGADTVKFDLVDVANSNKVLSSVAVSLSVIKTKDITDYTISTFTSPIYASVTAANTAQQQAYGATIKVYGKTNSGAKVLLANGAVIGSTVENKNDFNAVVSGTNYNSVKITANASLTAARPSAETIATVNLFHNSTVTALNTKITSSVVAPVAKDIYEIENTVEDKMTMTVADFNALAGNYVTKYDASGVSTTHAAFCFEIEDSYAKLAMLPGKFNVDVQKADGTRGTSVLTINAAGQITAANAVAGDVIYVTAITNNGLVKTIEVTIQ